MNGSAKLFKWVAGGLAVLLLVFVQIGISDVKGDIQRNSDSTYVHAHRIDSLAMQVSRHLDRHDVDRAQMTLQIAAIAKALNVPVVVDTTTARKEQKDSIP